MQLQKYLKLFFYIIHPVFYLFNLVILINISEHSLQTFTEPHFTQLITYNHKEKRPAAKNDRPITIFSYGYTITGIPIYA